MQDLDGMKENIDKIINKACLLWGVSREDALGRSRKVPIPFARTMIAKTIREVYGYPFMKIGDILNRDHATIIHYLKIYDAEYKYNKEFRNFANAMKEVTFDIRNDLQEELDDELNEIIG